MIKGGKKRKKEEKGKKPRRSDLEVHKKKGPRNR